MARAALDQIDHRAGDERQGLLRLWPDVLHALVAGGVKGDLAEGSLEVGLELALPGAQHEIFERIVERPLHLHHVRIAREHQRQFLLEHQDAGWDQRRQVPALVDQLRQHRNVELLVLAHALEIAEFEPRHAAAFFARRQRHRNAVVLVDRDEILARARLVAIDVAGGEQGDLAGRASGRLAWRIGRQDIEALAQRSRGVWRQPRVGVDPGDGLERSAGRSDRIDQVDDRRHDRIGERRAHGVGGGQRPVANRRALGAVMDGLGAQHQVREVEDPGVRRHVGTLRHVAEVAQEAVLDDLCVVLFPDPVDLHRFARLTRSNKVGNDWHRLTQRRQPWQISNARSISLRSAASS